MVVLHLLLCWFCVVLPVIVLIAWLFIVLIAWLFIVVIVLLSIVVIVVVVLGLFFVLMGYYDVVR